MENGTKLKTEHRLTKLETEVTVIKRQVTNHIPTALKEIDKRLDKIDNKLAYYAGGIGVIMVVGQAIINFM